MAIERKYAFFSSSIRDLIVRLKNGFLVKVLSSARIDTKRTSSELPRLRVSLFGIISPFLRTDWLTASSDIAKEAQDPLKGKLIDRNAELFPFDICFRHNASG